MRAAIQVLGAALGITLLLGSFGPALDSSKYSDYGYRPHHDHEIRIDGEVVRLDARDRDRCSDRRGENSGWIQLANGAVICTDKRGRVLRTGSRP